MVGVYIDFGKWFGVMDTLASMLNVTSMGTLVTMLLFLVRTVLHCGGLDWKGS